MRRGNGRRRGLRTAAALAVLATLGALAAGCGSGSPSAGVAQLGTTTTAAGTPTTEGSLGSSSGVNGPTSSAGGAGVHARISIDGATRKQSLQYAQCMRSHGVPSFPDPGSDGSFTFTGQNPKQLPNFGTADKACRKLIPAGKPPSPAEQARQRQQALQFSACMRSHGFPQFPDPTFSDGGIQLRLNRSSGMDPNSPRFQAAQRACQSLMPGGSSQQAP